jgi:hypothetical protein
MVVLFLYSVKVYALRQHGRFTILGVVFALIIFGIILLKFTVYPLSNPARNYMLVYYHRIDTALVGYPVLFFSGYVIFRRGFSDLFGRVVTILWLSYCSFYIYNWRLIIQIFYGSEMGEGNLSYIFLSSGFALISLATIYTWKDTMWNTLVFIISVSFLFVIPSRSTFIAFFVASTILYFGRSRFLGKQLTIMVALLLIILVFSARFFDIDQILDNSRLLNTNLIEDTSLHARRDIARMNRLNFVSNWVLGDFMSDVRLHGESGYETHSYLSFWEQFGFSPFLLFILLYSGSVFIVAFKKVVDQNVRFFLGILLIYTSFLVIFARGFNEPLPFLCIGATLGFFDRNRLFQRMQRPVQRQH